MTTNTKKRRQAERTDETTTPVTQVPEGAQEATGGHLERLGARVGPNGAWALWLGLSAAVTAAVVLGAYLLVVLVATQLVPLSGLLVATYLGVSLETLSMQTALLYWAAPTVFMLLVLLALTLVVLAKVWGWRTGLVIRMRTVLVGEGAVRSQAGGAVPSLGKAVLRSSRDHNGLRNEEKN